MQAVSFIFLLFKKKNTRKIEKISGPAGALRCKQRQE